MTGVLFGLAGATDARGMVLAGAAVAGAVCWSPRAVPRLLAALGLALTVRWAVLWRLPVQLLSLGQQIALQRDLHARESRIPTCVDHHAAAVQISELWSPCAAQTAWLNLHRLLPMAPLPIAVIALVALLGVRRRNAPLLGMVLTIVPATLLVGLEHRYLLPLAGPVAVLIGSGVARVGGLMARAPWFATRPGPAARLTPAAALVLTVWIIGKQLGFGFSGLIHEVGKSSYTRVLDIDWHSPRYFVKNFLSGIFITIVMTGLDQEMMQKNLSCRSLKEAQKNMFTFSFILVFVNMLFLFLGAILYIYASSKNIALPERSDDLIKPVIYKIVIDPRKIEEMFFRPFYRIRHHGPRMQDKSPIA